MSELLAYDNITGNPGQARSGHPGREHQEKEPAEKHSGRLVNSCSLDKTPVARAYL